MSQSVYKQFSENLIALCARHGSIADVCRQTGINRQQFSRYLTGASLPNEVTLGKIASFFGLPQTDLFQAGVVAANRSDIRKSIAAISELPPELKSSASSLIEKSADITLPSATYAIYAPWAQADGRIVRGTLLVSTKKNAGLFNLHMPIDRPQSSGALVAGEIEGFITQDRSRISMIGYWSEWQLATCHINLYAENGAGETIWHGILSTFLPTGVPVACKVIIDQFGPQQRRGESVTNDDIMSADDARVPDHIRMAVRDLIKVQATLVGTDAFRNWRTS